MADRAAEKLWQSQQANIGFLPAYNYANLLTME
jgi:hypothetical protein